MIEAPVRLGEYGFSDIGFLPRILTSPLKPHAFSYDPQLATPVQDMVQHTCLAFSMHDLKNCRLLKEAQPTWHVA